MDSPPAGGTSTNSHVNAPDAPAQAIRNVYKTYGLLENPDNSWKFFGWTADLNPVQQGCVTIPRCQLFIHYTPDPDVGYWGSIIDFRRHSALLIYDGLLKAADSNAIMTFRWDVNSAYWVQLPFYYSWEAGTKGQPMVLDGRKIGAPLMDKIGTDPTRCPAGQGCIGYQRFSHGYIWESAQSGVEVAEFCPDVAGAGSSPGNPGAWPDDVVDLSNDILSTINAYDPGGANTPTDPTARWEDARMNTNGDKVIDLSNDILDVINHYLIPCHP